MTQIEIIKLEKDGCSPCVWLISQTAHISLTSADAFGRILCGHIDEMQSEGLVVEVQYQTTMQPNGQAIFSAVIFGRIGGR